MREELAKMEHVFPTYSRWDMSVESAEGAMVTGTNGKAYLDFTSGIGVCNLGHRHPEVERALEEQIKKVWHVSNLFAIEGQEQVAAKLTAHSSGDFVFFCNSGAEANEAAIKLARKHTGKSKIITFDQSFHGRTFATMSATGQSKIHDGFGPLLQQFVYVPYNDMASLEAVIDDDTAAIMLEVVQGEGGIHVGNAEFLQEVEKLCHNHGALFIIDEVQTGIGRTGKAFAYEHFHLSPDIITSAKGLGNGFPVGAMIGKAKFKETFGPGSHGSTFGGNPLAMSAANAVLEQVLDETFLTGVAEKAEYLLQCLEGALKDEGWVKEIRGIGMMIGIESEHPVSEFLKPLRDNGLLALVAGANVLRLLPPLTVTKREIDDAVRIIKTTMSKELINK